MKWKVHILMLGLLIVSSLSAQDTVRIREVQVYEERQALSTEKQELDSMQLMDPTNKDLGASLQKYSHAFVKSYGIGSSATVSLRGSGSSHTKLMWNGTNLNSSSHGVADLSLYPPFFTEKVGVVYGQNSNQFGSGGLGGAISIDNQVQFDQQELFLQQQMGSFGYRSTAARVKIGGHRLQSISRLLYTTANNDFDYSDRTAEGFPTVTLNHANFLQRGLLQSFHYRIQQDQRLDLHFWYLHSDRELPAMMALKDLQERQEDKNLRVQAIYHRYFKQGKLSFNSSLIREEILYQNQQLEHPGISDNRSFKNFLKAEWKEGDWYLNFRGDLDWEQSLQAHLNGGKAERSRQSLFGEIKKLLGESSEITAAARQEWVGNQQFFLPQLRFDQAILDQKGKLWVMAGLNTKVPSLNDLYWSAGGNTQLRAERSRNLELGESIGWELSDQISLNSKLTLFYALIEDYIQWVPGDRGFWMARNLKEVESKGLEAALRLNLKGAKWQNELSLLYNYTSSINLQSNHEADESVGKQLIYVPEHQYNFHWTANYKQYLLEANLQFVSARYLHADHSAFLPYYQTIDLSLGRRLKLGSDQLNASISVRNLLDQEYQAIQWRPMPGRNYMISLNYSLR